MSEPINAIGLAGLGALLATTIFLATFVVLALRLGAWLKGAGFRFQDFEAHQDERGVRLNSAFKRHEFSDEQPSFPTSNAPSVTVSHQRLEATPPGQVLRRESAAKGWGNIDLANGSTVPPAEVTYTEYARAAVARPARVMQLVVIASEDLPEGVRLAADGKDQVRIATATETDVGVAPAGGVKKGKAFTLKIPVPSDVEVLS